MSLIVIPQRFAQRRDTTANWEAVNPVLWNGEIGFVIDPGQPVKMKVGNGSSAWSSLQFFASNGKEVELRSDGTYIQWKYTVDSTWNNLVALASLRGADGADGADGLDGADGASAYDLAVLEGFVGTLSDWLLSLKGDKGDTGDVGPPGTPYARRIQTVADTGSGTLACNWALYDEIRVTLTADVVLTFSGAVDGQGCVLKLRQDNTGGHTVGMPSAVRFNSLITSFSVTPGGDKIDKVGFVYDDEDTRYDLVSLVPGIVS
jgi:hypothetical protein